MALKGHGFSRAANDPKYVAALAAEGCSETCSQLPQTQQRPESISQAGAGELLGLD
jgi:hypothetical protein